MTMTLNQPFGAPLPSTHNCYDGMAPQVCP
jgi:hypothetical protein